MKKLKALLTFRVLYTLPHLMLKTTNLELKLASRYVTTILFVYVRK